VKSKGDFADILAEGDPDIWMSHRPASGGEAGAMFEKIIRRALEMRGDRGSMGSTGSRGSKGKRSKGALGSTGSTGAVKRKTAAPKRTAATAKRTR
jgi:hypothetical protein